MFEILHRYPLLQLEKNTYKLTNAISFTLTLQTYPGDHEHNSLEVLLNVSHLLRLRMSTKFSP